MTADLLIQSGHWYLDRKGDVHGPIDHGIHTLFTDGTTTWFKSGVEITKQHDLDLLTECDRHGNPRREEKCKCEACAHLHPCDLFIHGTSDLCGECLHLEKCHEVVSHHWFLNLKGIPPVEGDVLVDVELKNGSIVRGLRANSWYWSLTSSNPITAYRLQAKGVEGAQGPDWYCSYCDKMVPHVDTKNSHHDEAKGGCGNLAQPNKLDKSQLPAGWLKKDVERAEQKLKESSATPAASDPVPVGVGDAGERMRYLENICHEANSYIGLARLAFANGMPDEAGRYLDKYCEETDRLQVRYLGANRAAEILASGIIHPTKAFGEEVARLQARADAMLAARKAVE